MTTSTFSQREEYFKLKRKRRIIKYSLVLFLILLLIGTLSYISYRPEIRISQVVLNGGIIVTQEEIASAVVTYMKGSHFFLVPKNNAFIYPRQDLEKHLADSFKRIETIRINRQNLTTIEVSITERRPSAIWCDALPKNWSNPDPNAQCYFMDQDGKLFDEAPYFSGDAYFKYYGMISTSTPVGNYYIASSTMFTDVSNFVEATRKLSIHPIYLIAKEDGQYSLVLEGGGEIYFDLKEPLYKVVKNLEALLESPTLSTTSTYYLPIEYIDLRFGNKLFYKLKGE